jgi:hypothetical protein
VTLKPASQSMMCRSGGLLASPVSVGGAFNQGITPQPPTHQERFPESRSPPQLGYWREMNAALCPDHGQRRVFSTRPAAAATCVAARGVQSADVAPGYFRLKVSSTWMLTGTALPSLTPGLNIH